MLAFHEFDTCKVLTHSISLYIIFIYPLAHYIHRLPTHDIKTSVPYPSERLTKLIF